jgi:Fur family ferric uptake transcriptional regulator
MESQEFISLFRTYLKSRGLHVTRARERIAREVFSLGGHFDASTLWARLQPARIASATIYRTLDLLVEAGLVRRWMLYDRACYEASLGKAHHEHMVCTRCGRVVEFGDAALEERLAEIIERLGFRHERHQVVVYGVCPACQ